MYYLNIDSGFIGEKSKTYKSKGNEYYSTYFHGFVKFRKYGEIEVVEYDGKTYFFRPDGKIEKEEMAELIIEDMGEQIIYRMDKLLYGRNKKTGNRTCLRVEGDSQNLQWRDVYYFSLLENIIRELAKK